MRASLLDSVCACSLILSLGGHSVAASLPWVLLVEMSSGHLHSYLQYQTTVSVQAVHNVVNHLPAPDAIITWLAVLLPQHSPSSLLETAEGFREHASFMSSKKSPNRQVSYYPFNRFCNFPMRSKMAPAAALLLPCRLLKGPGAATILRSRPPQWSQASTALQHESDYSEMSANVPSCRRSQNRQRTQSFPLKDER